MGEQHALAVRKGTVADLDTIYARLMRDFPAGELKDRAQFERLLAGGHYTLYLARHIALQTDIGYAFVYEPASPKIAWLDYIAIEPAYRSAGFGAALFQQLCGMLTESLGVMLEVEPATSDDPATSAVQRRRIAFYERMGARPLDVDYLFPSKAGPLPMLLFFRPVAKIKTLPKEQITTIITAVYEHIHADVATRQEALQAVIDAVRDQHL